jgi:hypothetical protein
MRSEFPAHVPKDSVLYRTRELPLGRMQPLLLKALTALQSLSTASKSVKIIEDWLEHDGLEFAKGLQPLAFLFSIAATPRSLFEQTPKDDFVYLRAEAADEAWTVRFRTAWDADDREQVGDFYVAVAAQYAPHFEKALAPEIHDGGLQRD